MCAARSRERRWSTPDSLLSASCWQASIGTTGASVLLIRPLLRANAARLRVRHVVIFFIFTVSNGAGLLTPLGDPPLFLGFLRGVPFGWTLRLFPAWALLNGVLLVLFNLIDQYVFNKEERQRPGAQLEQVQSVKEKLRIEGSLNLIWLVAVPAIIALMGTFGPRWFGSPALQGDVQALTLIAVAALSLVTTPKHVHRANQFGWAPIIEVAVVFLGIFVTMIPALGYLEVHGGALGIKQPWQFFWAAERLSSFLDNAPTYLTFTSLAVGVINQTTGHSFSPRNLVRWQRTPGRAVAGGHFLRRRLHGCDDLHRQRSKLHGEGDRRTGSGAHAGLFRLHGLVGRRPAASSSGDDVHLLLRAADLEDNGKEAESVQSADLRASLGWAGRDAARR